MDNRAPGDGALHPEWIRDLSGEYGKVEDSLRRHQRPGFEYPSPELLKRLVRSDAPVVRSWARRNQGFPAPYPPGARDARTCDPAEKWIGPGKDTPGPRLILEAADRDDPRPLDPKCSCYTCRTFSRAYLRHLFQAGEILFSTLATLHNLTHYLDIARRMREAILLGTFPAFLSAVRASGPAADAGMPAGEGGGRLPRTASSKDPRQ